MFITVKLITFSILFLLISHQAFSQYANIHAGVKLLNFKSSNIQLAYLDESPAPDYFYSNVNAEASMLYNIGASADGFKHEKGIYYDIDLNLFFGKDYWGGDLGVGIGYPLYLTPKKKITLIPVISSGYGISSMKMGKLYNNTGYIQVNETIFNVPYVDVSLSRSYIPIRPSLNVIFDLSKKFQLRLNAAYLYSVYTTNTVRFTSGEISDSEDLDEPNLFFRVDGADTKKSPVDIKGLEFRIGFAFRIGKQENSETKK